MVFTPPPPSATSELTLQGVFGVPSLSMLQQVHGSLSLDTDNLAGAFPALGQVGGSLEVIGSATLTTMAGAFPALTFVQGAVTISSNSLLATAAGAFPVLQEIGDYLEINTCPLNNIPTFPALTTIGLDRGGTDAGAGGGLHLSALTGTPFSLAGAFPVLQQVSSPLGQEGVGIYTNTAITSLAGAFPVLQGTQWFEIDTNVNVISMAGFAPAVSLFPANYGYFGIYSNAALTTLENAFANSLTSDYVEVYDNPLLTNCDGAWARVITGTDYNYIEFYGNGPLTLNGAFADLVFTDYVEIYGTPGQAGAGNLSGGIFPSLVKADYIEFYFCLGLTSLNGAFPALTDLGFRQADRYPFGNSASRENGYIEVFSNPVITDVGGLVPALIGLDRAIISVNDNALLTTFSLPNTTKLGKIEVLNSPVITSLAGFYPVLTTTKIGINLTGNAVLADVSALLAINGANFYPNNANGFREVIFLNNPLLPTTPQAGAVITNLQAEGYTGATTNSGNLPDPVTLPPPGTPEFWLDGFDIDGASNSTLTPGLEFSSWKNKGSLVGVDPVSLPFQSDPKYYVGPNIKGARFDGTGGGFTPHRGLGVAVAAQNYPFTYAVIVRTGPTWTSFGNNMIGSYQVGLPAPSIGIRPGFVSFIGETWQGQNVNNGNTPFGCPITTPGGIRQVVSANTFTVLTCVFDGLASSFGTDHQAMAFDPLALGIHNFRGLVVGGNDEALSQFFDGEIAQALVYYGTPVTHAQIVAWAESVYGGTAPFAP